MKHYYTIFFMLLSFQIIQAQDCLISSNDNNLTQAEVEACLSPCTMNCTLEITANVSLSETIDLSAFPGLTFTISGSGNLTLNNGSDLILSATSTLVVTSTNPNPLKTNEPATEPVIIIGGTSYTDDDFNSIVSAGGADANGVLPIELIAFTGRQNHNQILIEWSTATEINNDYMIVEHSSDGRNFLEIGRLAGAGTSAILNQYAFQHNQPAIGINYYRLQQVDYDGKSTYHTIISVAFKKDTLPVTIFPNPAGEQLQVQLNTPLEGEVHLQVLDMMGRILQEKESTFYNNELIDLKKLESGIYFLKIHTKDLDKVIRFKKK